MGINIALTGLVVLFSIVFIYGIFLKDTTHGALIYLSEKLFIISCLSVPVGLVLAIWV